MWPTMSGLRVLDGAEADLVRRAIGVMLGQLVTAFRDQADPPQCGIDWFDQWDCDQRVWLLEQVARALLTTAAPPSPAAMWEATIDAIFCEVHEEILAEIDATRLPESDTSWRQRVIAAFGFQHGRLPSIDAGETDGKKWATVVTQIADTILGISSYQKAESFRDRDIDQSRRFLIQRGLPKNFLECIPPLRRPGQTAQSIACIESLLGL